MLCTLNVHSAAYRPNLSKPGKNKLPDPASYNLPDRGPPRPAPATSLGHPLRTVPLLAPSVLWLTLLVMATSGHATLGLSDSLAKPHFPHP